MRWSPPERRRGQVLLHAISTTKNGAKGRSIAPVRTPALRSPDISESSNRRLAESPDDGLRHETRPEHPSRIFKRWPFRARSRDSVPASSRSQGSDAGRELESLDCVVCPGPAFDRSRPVTPNPGIERRRWVMGQSTAAASLRPFSALIRSSSARIARAASTISTSARSMSGPKVAVFCHARIGGSFRLLTLNRRQPWAGTCWSSGRAQPL